MSDDTLIESATGLATSIRMGEGPDPVALQRFRAELVEAAGRWREAGVVGRREAALLVELYPALLGSLGLYSGDPAREIADLAESLLDEVLSALDE